MHDLSNFRDNIERIVEIRIGMPYLQAEQFDYNTFVDSNPLSIFLVLRSCQDFSNKVLTR